GVSFAQSSAPRVPCTLAKASMIRPNSTGSASPAAASATLASASTQPSDFCEPSRRGTRAERWIMVMARLSPEGAQGSRAEAQSLGPSLEPGLRGPVAHAGRVVQLGIDSLQRLCLEVALGIGHRPEIEAPATRATRRHVVIGVDRRAPALEDLGRH